MENATKALLIAGSVLIAIVLIAVGIKILGSTQGVTGQVDNVSDAMAKSIFNSQFQQYEGIQKGSVVKTLFSKVVANNANAEDDKSIIFYYYYYPNKTSNIRSGYMASPTHSAYTNAIGNISSWLTKSITSNFQVTTSLNTDGYVYLIKVSEIKN